MARSAIHIIDKIHKQWGSKWPLECKNKAYKLWGQWPTTRLQSRLYIYDNSDQHYHLKLLMSHHDQTQLVESRLPNFAVTNFSIGSVTWVSNFWRYSALICPIISFGAPHGFTWPPIPAKCCLNLLIPPPSIDFWQYLQIILPSIISQWAHAVSLAFGGMMTTWKCKLASLAFSWRWKLHWQLHTISKIAPTPTPRWLLQQKLNTLQAHKQTHKHSQTLQISCVRQMRVRGVSYSLERVFLEGNNP